MRKLLAILLLSLGLPLEAAQCRTANFFLSYDVDADTVIYGVVQGQGSNPFGGTIPVTPHIKTSGSSTTVTSETASTNAFAELSVGDSIFIRDTTGAVSRRLIIAKADADTVTVDSAITLSDAAFTWLKSTTSTTVGWLDVSGWTGRTLTIQYDAGDLGQLDARVECRGGYPGAEAVQVFPSCTTGACNTYQAYTTIGIASRTSIVIPDPFGACRVGLKYTTSDPATVTITEGVNDDVDFTEDAGGTPKACVATLDAGAYTTCAALAAELQTQMAAASCTPDNTYTASCSSTTGKLTIARATGTKTLDLPWNTGTNTATTAGAALGFSVAADDTGATTYTSDNVVATDESVNLEKVTVGFEACVEN